MLVQRVVNMNQRHHCEEQKQLGMRALSQSLVYCQEDKTSIKVAQSVKLHMSEDLSLAPQYPRKKLAVVMCACDLRTEKVWGSLGLALGSQSDWSLDPK